MKGSWAVACVVLLPVASLPAEGPKLIATLKGHSDEVRCLTFSLNGKLVAGATGRTTKVWDLTTGKEVATLKADSNHISSLAFSPDSKLLAVGQTFSSRSGWPGGQWGVTTVWDIVTGKRTLVLG